MRDDVGLSARLLTVGLVLTVAAGAVGALILHPQEGLAFACLLGAILAPTDAALGLPIFNNPKVPGAHPAGVEHRERAERRHRHAVCPAVPVTYAVATEAEASGGWLTTALIEIAVAVVAGVAIGAFGGWLLT